MSLVSDWLTATAAGMDWEVPAEVSDESFYLIQRCIDLYLLELNKDRLLQELVCNYPGQIRLPSDFTRSWVVKKGVLVGTFPKRVAHWFYKSHKLKLPQEKVAEIGRLARNGMPNGHSLRFDTTTSLDWNVGDFGDDGSCFWGSLSWCRNLLQGNRAFAVRTYTKSGHGSGRAWGIEHEGGVVLFNAYGRPLLVFARLVAEQLGLTYRQVDLKISARSLQWGGSTKSTLMESQDTSFTSLGLRC